MPPHTHTSSNPATVVPVKALEGTLVEDGFFVFRLILEQSGHLHVLHDFVLCSLLPDPVTAWHTLLTFLTEFEDFAGGR